MLTSDLKNQAYPKILFKELRSRTSVTRQRPGKPTYMFVNKVCGSLFCDLIWRSELLKFKSIASEWLSSNPCRYVRTYSRPQNASQDLHVHSTFAEPVVTDVRPNRPDPEPEETHLLTRLQYSRLIRPVSYYPLVELRLLWKFREREPARECTS